MHDHSGRVRNPLIQFAVVVLGALVLISAVFLGMTPIRAQVTTVTPPGGQVQASCGFHYLPAVPALPDMDPVPLPTDRKVLVGRAEYTARCDEATTWQPYAAWGLTVLGLLGFVVLVIARRQRRDEDAEPGAGGFAAPPSNPLWR